MLPRLQVVLAPAAVPLVLVAALIVLLGVFVVARERLSRVSVSFCVMTTSVAVWLIGVAAMYMSVLPETAMVWARIAYIGVATIPAGVFHFTLVLTNQAGERRRTLVATWIGATLFAILFTSTPHLLGGVWKYSWGFYPRLTPASSLFLVYFAAVLATSLAVLRGSLRSAATIQQTLRARSFLVALAVGYFGCIDYLPSFGIPIYPAGFVAIAGFLFLATKAIRRYRLVDLTPSFVAERLLETMQGGVIAVDMRGTIQLANRVAASLIGWHEREMVGRDLKMLLGVDRLPATESQTFARGGRTRNRPMVWTKRGGESVELSVSAEMLRDRSSLPVGLLYVMHDLEERRRAERHEFAAHHDALTGLANRVFLQNCFDDFLTDAIARGRVAATMFIDLDGFKEVNDRYGHAAGDAALRSVAERLRLALRKEDLVARYGGDEFVILTNLRDASDAERVAHKLQETIRGAIQLDGHIVHLDASVGIALYPGDGNDLDALIHAADLAMYTDKAGKSRRPIPREETKHLPVAREDRPAPPPYPIGNRLGA